MTAKPESVESVVLDMRRYSADLCRVAGTMTNQPNRDAWLATAKAISTIADRVEAAHRAELAEALADKTMFEKLYRSATEGAFGIRMWTECDPNNPRGLLMRFRVGEHGLVHAALRGEIEDIKDPLMWFGMTLRRIGEQFLDASRRKHGVGE